MTREDALKLLADARYADDLQGNNDLQTAHIMAMKALEQEPCEDAISRQYLIDIATTDGAYDYVSAQEIANAPSVTPKPKIGHWIVQDIHNCHTDFKCSECDYIKSFMHLYGEPIADYTYCPNCGAKMESEVEE